MKAPCQVPIGRVARAAMTLRSCVGAALLLVLALWAHGSHPTAILGEAVNAQLQLPPPINSQAVAKASCADQGTPPLNDEDRFLVTDDRRKLTGRSQRKGNTYVTEATSRPAGGCADTTVQLYLFRDGGFVGPATPYSLPAKRARFESFLLVDPEHLRYVVADSAVRDSRCVRIHSRQPEFTTTLIKGTRGWTLRMDFHATTSYQLRQPPRYPRDAHGHLNEGTVLVHVSVDKDGFPMDVRITRGSSHPELDKRAIESLRGGCFDPAKSSVDIPVRFSINHL